MLKINSKIRFEIQIFVAADEPTNYSSRVLKELLD